MLTLTAPAKLNLSLSVAPPEPATAPKPGWHRIASWFVAIDLADEITIERLADGAPSRFDIAFAPDALAHGVVDWPLEKDLAVRAHALLERHAGRALPVSAVIRKRIPAGAGLGGGSSDAAAILLGLNALFDLRVGVEELRNLSVSLGSDVAFFLDDAPGKPRPALVTSFGDVIERVAPIPAEFVLILPPFSCATPAVYQAFDAYLPELEAKRDAVRRPDGGKPPQPKTANDSLIRARFEKMLIAGKLKSEHLFNDLFIPATRVEPRLGTLMTALAKGTREDVHLTGSGSGIFLVTQSGRGPALLDRVRRTLTTLAAAEDTPLSGVHCAATLVRTA